MKPNELRELGKMTLFLQDLTTKLCLRHFPVKVSGNSSIEFAWDDLA